MALRLRKYLADWIDGIACRLDRWAETLHEKSWKLRPRSKDPSILSDLIHATLHNQRARLAEDVVRNNALLQSLRDKQ